MRTPPAVRRGGVALVESALLLSLFLMFLFGILEYSRYLFLLHVAANAARDGARYACVHVSLPGNFDYADATVGGTTYPSVWKYTLQRMGGADQMLSGCVVNTYPCNTASLYGTSANNYTPVVTPKSGYLGPNATDYNNGNQTLTTVTRTTDWNGASFGEKIAVVISGTYQPVLPNFLFMTGTTSVNIIALVGSEG